MNIDNKFLLVCLQLIIVVLMSMNAEGMPDRSSLTESYPDRSTTRALRLYNNCVGKHIVIQDRISATGDETDDKAIVILETAMDMGEGRNRIRIRGNSTGKYLCFNHKGKLVAKPKSLLQKPGRRGREKCEFYEVSGRSGWSYQSVMNHDWYVGFNLKGTPKNGAADRTKHENCFSFSKYPIEGGFDPKDHNSKVGTVGQTIPGFINQQLLENLQLNSVVQPHRHRHESSRLTSRASHNMRSTKKSHRNRKSFSRTKTER